MNDPTGSRVTLRVAALPSTTPDLHDIHVAGLLLLSAHASIELVATCRPAYR